MLTRKNNKEEEKLGYAGMYIAQVLSKTAYSNAVAFPSFVDKGLKLLQLGTYFFKL